MHAASFMHRACGRSCNGGSLTSCVQCQSDDEDDIEEDSEPELVAPAAEGMRRRRSITGSLVSAYQSIAFALH